ncbi:MAG TPA: phosphate ABC transporter permease subunit PstC [Candidatus Limnocylindrales bacterium]
MTAGQMKLTRRRPWSERIIETFLFVAAAFGVMTTIGIVVILAYQTLLFFQQVDPIDFLTGTVWSASIQPYKFGVLALVSGTLLVAVIAMIIGTPLGLLSAVLLSEYSSNRVRNVVKPVLETIAGIPTIVLGFFAISFLSPQLLQPLFGVPLQSALAGGVVVGILITPLIASISEDAMRAVPRGLREGAYAMGATKFEVVRKVVLPAAISGVMASIILAMSRAVGETMAVVLAVGTFPQLSFDPRESVQTMTAFIVQIVQGETAQGSVQFLSLFAVAMVLFVMTFILNLASAWFVRRYRTVY